MPSYSQDIIEEVRSRNPVVDVIGSYVHLTKKGGSYFGLCPFHNEKSPSFSVSASKQMYYCFGCGKGGNVLTFIMDYENCSFPEAMELLAKRAGIELPKQEFSREQQREADARSVLLKIHRDAAYFYCYVLKTPEGQAGLDYLKSRELSDETIRSFGLGYGGQRPDSLYRYLKSKGYTDQQLKDSGLVTLYERGARDRFWNRVMYPIMDVNSRVIGFGGRVMGQGEPKYLNSPETKIFDKSRNLYGLNVARKTREKYILVCEGYMDVISMHQAGFTNAVASLGTAFTGSHGMLLKRYTEEAVLCYDHDGAGKKAALRAIPILRETGLKLRVLDLSPYKDPDEFIKNMGKDAFRDRIRDARNAFLFEIDCLREEFDFQNPEDKSRFFHEAAKRLSAFSDEIERGSYTEAVSKEFGIDFSVLKKQVSAAGNQIGLTETRSETEKPKSGIQSMRPRDFGVQEAERLVLTALAERPGLFREIGAVLKVTDFSGALTGQVAALLFGQLKENRVNPAELLTHFIDTDDYSDAASILSSTFSEGMSEESGKQALQEAVRKVRGTGLDREIAQETDPSKLMELLRAKQSLRDLRLEV